MTRFRPALLGCVAALGALVFAAESRAPAPPVFVANDGSLSGTLTFSAARPRQPIVVYLEGVILPGEAAPLRITQKGAQFTPSFSVVVVGQEVVFENDEDKEIDHNVYTLGTEEINLNIFPPGAKRSHTFTKAGEVSLYCSVHKLMDGKLFVAPTAAHALVVDDGSFRIGGLPPGSYTLRTYQKAKRFKDAELSVTIKSGADTNVTVEMKR